jgi:hypothetical protein
MSISESTIFRRQGRSIEEKPLNSVDKKADFYIGMDAVFDF